MLAGNLDEFTLPDLFQLLALTNKSGALRISYDGAEGSVYFQDGQVYFSLADERRLPLGARLVASGHLSAERLRELLREHRGGSAVELAAALITSGEVEEATLELFLREQLYDALFSMLRREGGQFQFDAGVRLEWPGPLYSGTEALEEVHRRIDHAAKLAVQMPRPDAVLAIAPNPPGGSPLTLDRDQWQLLSLVDGKRTVAQLTDLSGKGEFATAKMMGELVETGLLEAHERPGEGALADLLAARHALRQLEEVTLGTQVPTPGHGGGSPLAASGAARPAGGAGPGDEASDEGQYRRRPSWLTVDEEPGAPSAGKDASTAGAQEPAGRAGVPDEPADEAADEPAAEADEPADEEPARTADTSDEGGDPEVEDPGTSGETGSEAGADPQEEADGGDDGGAPARTFDRAQVARELASLGLDDDAPRSARPGRTTNGTAGGAGVPAAVPPQGESAAELLGRDEDVNRGLLLRLIDGVKGA